MKRTLLISAIAAGMLWVASCGTNSTAQLSATAAASSAQSGGTEVDITLADNTIQSSLTTFKVGVPYRFVIINNGNHPHDFNISTPVDKAGSIDAALAGALLTVKQDQLAVGGGTTVVYTFPASAAGQDLEFSCLIRRHYEDGMRLAITLTN